MPGTVPRSTDPIYVTSYKESGVASEESATQRPSSFLPSSSSSSSYPATAAASKAALYPGSASADLVNESALQGHPSAGVASTGAAQLTAAGAATSAIAPSNKPAQVSAAMATSSSPAVRPSKRSSSKAAKNAHSSGAHTPDSGKEAELLKFIETNGHFSLVRNFHLADAFTLMNGFCGAQSLFASARYLITSDPSHAWTALWFPLFGAVFDLLDGKVARWRNSSSMLGQELDSLADSLSFGAAPAFAAYSLGLRLPLDTLLLTLFVCAGIARLARFNVTTASVPHDAKGKAQYFEGLPIPSSLILVGGMAICLLAGRVAPGGLPIALAKERGVLASEGLTFTASLRDVIPGANLGRGVPFGTFGYDWSPWASKSLASISFIRPHKHLIEWISSFANLEVHKLAILFGIWAVLMISKTLRVPKP